MAVRTIDVRERVMARNDEIAVGVRAQLSRAGVPAFNLVSSPGAGKTALLERTLADLGGAQRIAVVTGDGRLHHYRLDAYDAYFRRVRRRFEEAVAIFEREGAAVREVTIPTLPYCDQLLLPLSLGLTAIGLVGIIVLRVVPSFMTSETR